MQDDRETTTDHHNVASQAGHALSTKRIEVAPKTMVFAMLLAAGAWVTLRLAPVVLVLVATLFLVGTMNPAVEWLEHKRVKRGFGIALVFSSTVLVVVAVMALTIPTIVEQVGALARGLPAMRERLVDLLEGSRTTAPLAKYLKDFDPGSLVKSPFPTALGFSSRAFEFLAYLLTAVFGALYIVIDRDRLRGGAYAIVPRRHHVRLSRVLLNLEVIVGGYIRGQIITSVLMVVFTTTLLTLCGVKGALAIGVVAGIADVLPYIGVVLSVGPAVAAAASRGSVAMIIVLVAMLAYEEIESRFLVPKIYGNVLKLPSAVVLFSLLAGGVLMGIPGALLALPTAATIKMLVDELRVDLPGEDAQDTSETRRDEREERDYVVRTAGLPAEEAAPIAVAMAEKRTHRV